MLHPLVYPMFAMILFTFLFAGFMLYTRVTEIKKGKVKFSYFRTYVGDASDIVIKTSRHFTNLFEVPVIFYATILLLITLDISTSAQIVFAWVFVISRLFHAFFHVFASNIYPRMISYLVGWLAIVCMWFHIMSL